MANRTDKLVGNVFEVTWNGKMHTCCGSNRTNRHKAKCIRVIGKLNIKRDTTRVYVDSVTGNEVRLNNHRKRKNNLLVAAMYAMYTSGKSLAEIARAYRKTRQAIYDTFRTRGYELRSKKFEGLTFIDGYRFTKMKGYLRGTVEGKRIMAHHYIWQKHHGAIPDDSVLHFVDGNPLNISIENLALVKKVDMGKTFNSAGRNQFSSKLV